MLLKSMAVIFIVIGEVFSIYAQVKTAVLQPCQRRFIGTSPFLLLFWTVGGLFLVSGYVLGKQAWNGVWAITAISVTSILMVEPVMLLSLLSHRPARAEINGFLCGAVGLLITIVGSS